jgi:hypothetical protein
MNIVKKRFNTFVGEELAPPAAVRRIIKYTSQREVYLLLRTYILVDET